MTEYAETEINLRKERSILNGKIRVCVKVREKQERREAIAFYRDMLKKLGYEVYFWDPGKIRDDNTKHYRVCFAYKIMGQTVGDADYYSAFVSFCHPDDNFDRWPAWTDLYNQIIKMKGYNLLEFPLDKPEEGETAKKGIYNALRKNVVNTMFMTGRKPTLFKEHCKTVLKDV